MNVRTGGEDLESSRGEEGGSEVNGLKIVAE